MTIKNIFQLLSIILVAVAGAVFVSPWLGVGMIAGVAISVLVYVFWFGLLDAIYCEIVSFLDRDSF